MEYEEIGEELSVQTIEQHQLHVTVVRFKLQNILVVDQATNNDTMW